MLNCRAIKEIKRSSHSVDILRKIIKQSDWQREFWVKTQEPGC